MRDWVWRGAIIAAVLTIGLLQLLMPLEYKLWHDLFPRLYYLPIVAAALHYGWRGGLAAAVLAIAAFSPRIIASSQEERLVYEYIEILSFILVAILTGVLVDRERRQQAELRKSAEQLAAVYDKLQSNFEGMKRAERLSAIGQLSAGLAHEIRNPLASIAGAASILQRSGPPDARNEKCLEIITHECGRLNRLLTDFLNFAGPQPPSFQRVEIDRILDNVINLAVHAMARRNIDVRKRASDQTLTLDCDPEQLEQVLLNLVINAVQASPDEGEVEVAAEPVEDNVAIRVVDHGSGVRPEHIDRLFDPFFTTKETGTGLGLPVAHQIVGQMGGVLNAVPNPDGGMTFSVILPSTHERAA
jgi:two-component system, NtrC family, sensor histidine kinase HydH